MEFVKWDVPNEVFLIIFSCQITYWKIFHASASDGRDLRIYLLLFYYFLKGKRNVSILFLHDKYYIPKITHRPIVCPASEVCQEYLESFQLFDYYLYSKMEKKKHFWVKYLTNFIQMLSLGLAYWDISLLDEVNQLNGRLWVYWNSCHLENKKINEDFSCHRAHNKIRDWQHSLSLICVTRSSSLQLIPLWSHSWSPL